MTQNEKIVLTERLRKLSADIAELAALFDGNAESAEGNGPGDTDRHGNAAAPPRKDSGTVKKPEPAEPGQTGTQGPETVEPGQETATEPEAEEPAGAGEAPEQKPEPDSAPERTVTIEEVRAVLSGLSRMGHRPEAQALVVKHGVEKLTDIRDPGLYAVILKEAEALMKRTAPEGPDHSGDAPVTPVTGSE